jgi:hypothetical protein
MVQLDINEQKLLTVTGGLLLAASAPLVITPLKARDNWLQRGILGANPVTTSRATGLSAATTGAVAVAVAMAPNSRTAYKNALVGLGSGYAVSAASTFNDNRTKLVRSDKNVAAGVVQTALAGVCLYTGLTKRVKVSKTG